jgi:Fe-S-cluster containining protein
MKRRKITTDELLDSCDTCASGSCCKEGVEVDLKEVKRISKLNIRLKKPWFDKLSKNSETPSGWSLSTILRNNTCIFQQKDYKCLIYKYRPAFCRDFPFENGRIAKYYHYLCEKPPRFKRKAKRDLSLNLQLQD